MRSLAATVVLAAAATAAGTLATVQLSRGSLDRWFRDRGLPQGAQIYQFPASDVQQVTLKGGGVTCRMVRDQQGWQLTEPWKDRADPRLAGAIVAFTLGTRVEDTIPRTEIAPRQFGLETGAVAVHLRSAASTSLAHFVLGRRTAWFHQPENGDPEPTVFLRPLEAGRSRYVYAATGDIQAAFRDGFRFLRDHRPFFFHPDNLVHLRLKGPEGELTLARASPKDPWRITKPLELATEKDSVRRLIEGLFTLTALKVSNPADQTLPEATAAAATPTSPATTEIAIQSAGEPAETTLKVFPAADTAARSTLATVDNRDAVFELPLRSETDLTGVLELPLTVNELRDKALTRLHIPSLQAVLITPAGASPILVVRKPNGPWRFRADEKIRPVDERKLAELLKTVTEERVANFVTDAATDPAPYGLDQPFLSLRFLGFDNQALEIRFGRSPDGTIHAQRTGTPTVVRVDESLVSRIPTRAHHWKAPAVWSLAAIDVLAIERAGANQPPVLLSYQFHDESWRAKLGSEDASARLNTNRASFLLNALEQLQANRWLPPSDPAAAKALLTPRWQFNLLVRLTDDEGSDAGTARRELRIAPVSDSPENRFFYASSSTDPDCFILDLDTVKKLTVDLFEDG